MKKNRLSHLGAALLTLALLLCPAATRASAAETDLDVNGDGTIRILAIGSSFGVDGISQLAEVIKAEGETRPVELGNLYKGACTLAQHVSYISKAGYYYYKHSADAAYGDGANGTNYGYWASENGGELVTMDYALADDGKWDVVVIQQGAALAGVAETFADGNLETVLAHIRQTQPKARVYWHMSWAFPTTSERTGALADFTRYYGDDQMTMYHAILSAHQQYILPLVGTQLDGILPTGTAIQNVRTGYVAERDLHRDAQHLSNFGRVITGYTYYSVMTGRTLSTVALDRAAADHRTPGIGGDKVAYTLREADKALITQAVKNAVEKPFEVTPSTCTHYCGGPEHTGWTALTADTFAEAMTQSGTYYLGGSFSIKPTATIAVGADVTLCLNGKTLTLSSAQNLFTVNPGCKLTICDCGSGTVKFGGTSTKQAFVIAGGEVVVKGGTFTGFKGSNGGAVGLTADGSRFIVDRGTFTGNKAINGGVLFTNNNVTVELHSGAVLSDNTASKFGGAINMNGGTLKIYEGAVLSGNQAVGNATVTNNRGGAIRLGASGSNSATGYLYGGQITGNTADGFGSGVDVSNAHLVMRGGSISNNLAGTSTVGGGVFVDYNSASFVLDGGSLTGNAHSGICVRRGSVEMSGGQVTGNSGEDISLIAKTSGYLAKVTVKDGTVGTWTSTGSEEQNTVALWGGRFGQDPAGAECTVLATGTAATKGSDGMWQVAYDYAHAHPATREHIGWQTLESLVEAGIDTLDGGLYCLSGDVRAEESFTVTGPVVLCLHGHTLTDASGGTGQFFKVSAGGKLYLEDCAAQPGSITGGGTQRGLYVLSGGAAWLRGGTLQNFKSATGGGVRVDNGGAFCMEGGTITQNTCTGNGGAVYSYGDMTLSGGTVTDNTASNAGGAIIHSNGTLRISGGTVSNNSSASGKGDIHVIGGHYYGQGGLVDDVLYGSVNYIELSGGQYTTAVKAGWLADGCKAVEGSTLAHRVVRDLQTTGAVVENESSLSLRISLNQLVAPDFDRYRAVITKAFHYGDAGKDEAAQTAGKVEGTLAQLAVDGEYGAAYLTYANVSAKEMGDAVAVSVYTEDGLLLHTQTYSVADQIRAVLATEGIGTELKNLCVDALNYGAAAQERFGYNTADPVNAGLTQTSTTVVPEWTNGLSVSAGHEALYAATASLKEKLELNLYFDVDCSQSVPAVTVTADGKAVGHTVSTVSNGTKTILRVTVDGLDVKDAKALITCTVGEITVTDSIASYLVRNTSQRDRAVIGALMRYVESAIALARLAG